MHLRFSHDEYNALQEAAGLLDRSSHGRIELTGADRRSYLQGLLTNDINALSPGTGCYAALLTPQGRMISDMRVSELGDALLLDLPGSAADTVRQRLADFVFTEDVEVIDARPAYAHVAVYGPQAARMLASVLRHAQSGDAASRRERLEAMAPDSNALWELPRADARVGSATAPHGDRPPRRVIIISSRDFGVPGFEVFLPSGEEDAAADAADVQAALRALGAVEVSAATVNVTRVEAGRPEFGTDMDESTIPLEAGIEDRAVSTTKGCYVGQEVIVRVLHRGQGRVARRLVGLVGSPAEGTLERGDRVLADGKEVGRVTSAVLSPRLGRPIGLGYVHRDHAIPGKVLQAGRESAGPAHSVTIATLPFTAAASE